MRGAYFEAFVLDLATGNVALVRQLRPDAYQVPVGYYVVDLDLWEPTFPNFQFGSVIDRANDSHWWRARSRWRRLRLWLKKLIYPLR